ncbi:MAG TPA: hypothetical protein VH186_22930 [Chloroflexia bacterium]|nr:hypothetical protein [Chloroflexia bacterium]
MPEEKEQAPVQGSPVYAGWWRLDHPAIWFAVALLIYSLTAGKNLWAGTNNNYYAWQAYAWLHGHLWLPTVTDPKLDLTFYNGHWYSAFPPMPALIMLPFALIWGADANQVMVSVALGALNVVLMRLLVDRLGYFAHFKRGARCWLTLLFGFGTVAWQSAIQGSVWYFAHGCVMLCLLLALWLDLDGRRPFLTGVLVALAGLARPTAFLGLLFWLAILLKRYLAEEKPQNWFRALFKYWTSSSYGPLKLVAGPALALGFTFAYNRLRFHSFTDFGYQNMLVAQNIKDILKQYGQFNPHFFSHNFKIAFLSLPQFQTHPPFLLFNTDGNSLLFITPAFLLAALSLRHFKAINLSVIKESLWQNWSAVFTLAGLLTVSATLLPLMLYYNTGQVQFGYRFLQDCLPFLLLMVALGWPRSRRGALWAIGLVLISVALNFYGVMWYQNFWPELFGSVPR